MKEFYHIFDSFSLNDLQTVGNLGILALAATCLFVARMLADIGRRK